MTDKLPKSFDELIRSARVPVLVDFWAEWCAPCRTVSPVVKRLAQKYAGRLLTVKVNIDKKPHVAAQYQVQSIPTIVMFWNGDPVMRAVGAQSYAELRRQVEASWPADLP